MRIDRLFIVIASFVLVGTTVLGTPTWSFGQSSDACNRPATNPIMDFKLDGTPRNALPSQDGCWIFLHVVNFRDDNKTISSGVAVLRRDSGAIKLVRYQPIPGLSGDIGFAGNQEMIIAPADRQLVVLDVAGLTSVSGKAIRGVINDAHFTNKPPGGSSLSRDGRYMVRSQGPLSWISIVDLQKVEAGIFGPEAIAGGFPTEQSPTGVVFAPDEKHFFFISHPPPPLDSSLKCRNFFSRSVTDPLVAPILAISAVNISTAVSSTTPEIVASGSAGCGLLSLTAAPDGKTLYAASHTGNTLLAFDVRPFLEDGKAPTLIGTVPVGPQPREVVVVDGGKRVIVANSNQYLGTVTDSETLTVIDTAKISAGAEAVLGNIRVGADPRHVTVTADGRTLIVSNIKSRTLQFIDLESVPLEPVGGLAQ